MFTFSNESCFYDDMKREMRECEELSDSEGGDMSPDAARASIAVNLSAALTLICIFSVCGLMMQPGWPTATAVAAIAAAFCALAYFYRERKS